MWNVEEQNLSSKGQKNQCVNIKYSYWTSEQQQLQQNKQNSKPLWSLQIFNVEGHIAPKFYKVSHIKSYIGSLQM